MTSDDYDPDDPLEGASKCPHCGGKGIVVAHDELRYVCGICGGPRVRVDADLELSGDEKEPLSEAEKARKSRFLWRVAGLVGSAGGAFGLLASVLTALLLGWGWGLGGVVMSLPFILLAIAGLAKARGKSEDLQRHVETAWRTAARDVAMRTEGGVDAKVLSEVMHLSEAGAEQMMADLAVEEMLRSRINDDGRLRVEPIAPVRIDVAARPDAKTVVAEDALEERFEALEEAFEAERAAEAQRSKKE